MNPDPESAVTSVAPHVRRAAYRLVAVVCSVVFVVVGLLFLVAPGAVVSWFDGVSAKAGLATFGNDRPGFFVALAAAYMYLVALLAWRMFRQPSERVYPVLLANAKFASAVVSLALFAVLSPHLMYLSNAVVDGCIGFLTLSLLRFQKSFTA